jgi:hypothetical protein
MGKLLGELEVSGKPKRNNETLKMIFGRGKSGDPTTAFFNY